MGMTIDNVLEILEKHKLRIPSNVFYELKADIVNFEEPTTKNDAPENNVGNIEPTTKNDLGVDCISRADAKAKKIYSHERHEYVVPVAEIDWLSSVTPQEPILDKIRAEVENINVWGLRYNSDTDKDRKPQIVQKVKEHVIEIIDEYKAESEDKE